MCGEEVHPKCRTCLHYTRQILTFLFSHIGLVSLVVGYCLVGAVIFKALEAEHEREVKRNMTLVRERVTGKLWKRTYELTYLHDVNWSSVAEKTLKEFETTLLKALKKDGWDGSEDETQVQWTFAGALFYSIIVITTIGYGHIAPKTQWGKVVTIFYAILGIPLMLLCLSNIGDAMAHSFRFLYWKVCCYFCTKKPKRHVRRRGRSFRHSGSRYGSSSRSRTTSIRRSQRHSQRSADSAVSDSALSRSSYSVSDPEQRYFKDIEGDPSGTVGNNTRATMESTKHQLPKLSLPPGRSSDTALHLPPEKGGRMGTQTPISFTCQLPVISNKYALMQQREQSSERNPTVPIADTVSTNPGVVPPPSEAVPSRHSASQSHPLAHYHSYPYRQHRGKGGRGQHTETLSAPQTPVGSRYPSTISRHREVGEKWDPIPAMSAKEEPSDTELGDYIYEYDDDSDAEPEKSRPVPIWLCVCLVVSYILGGAWLFMEWEKWVFLDAAYFCFITLTTIGFGDFVPAHRVKGNAEVSIALCSLYLLFGIALLAMSFNLVQEQVINSVKGVAKRLGILKSDEDDEEDDE